MSPFSAGDSSQWFVGTSSHVIKPIPSTTTTISQVISEMVFPTAFNRCYRSTHVSRPPDGPRAPISAMSPPRDTWPTKTSSTGRQAESIVPQAESPGTSHYPKSNITQLMCRKNAICFFVILYIYNYIYNYIYILYIYILYIIYKYNIGMYRPYREHVFSLNHGTTGFAFPSQGSSIWPPQSNALLLEGLGPAGLMSKIPGKTSPSSKATFLPISQHPFPWGHFGKHMSNYLTAREHVIKMIKELWQHTPTANLK